MHGHNHVDQVAGSSRELVGAREHFAGMDAAFLTGGSGMVNAPVAPPNANGVVVGSGQDAHHGVNGLVLLAVVVLFVLDKAGFRFAVTAGRR